MSLRRDGAAASFLPFSDRVRQVDAGQPMRWLADGLRDYLAAPVVSSTFGFVFAAIGLALAYALWRTPFFYMLLPLACGFMLLGPVATSGFQAISRELEQGGRPSFAAALGALKANVGPIFYAALAFMLLFMAWLRISEILFALAFPTGSSLDAQSLLSATFFTADGLKFLALFVIFGFCVAAVAFAGGAFALSMLIDKPVGAAEAIATSFTAVALNARTMAVWAAILVVLTAVGMAFFFVGLVVTLPIAGHAAWHAYRATIRR
jgi:uncharacterized membrane protein